MLRSEAKAKIAIAILNMLSHITYKLDGVTKRADFFSTNIDNGKININVYLGEPVGGTITDITLIDKDGMIFDDKEDTIIKSSTKGFYFTFEYSIEG